ncbi:MAG: hypothetical protein HKN29_03605 [Rhodothermales bacterium]|nr:hypothetical protein [Rhodothermales bacterium]
MPRKTKVLQEAKAKPAKVRLEEHRDTVEELRRKGYSWREVAGFLSEQGIQVDHTRVYRTFGAGGRRTRETRALQLDRAVWLGERKTKRGRFWNVLELELPARFEQPIPVVGYVYASEDLPAPQCPDGSIALRNAQLTLKTGGAYPMAYIEADFEWDKDEWRSLEVYIVPNWESLLAAA